MGMFRRRFIGSMYVLLALASGSAHAAFEQILKLGDVAPGVGTGGYTISSFVEPPSVIESGTDSNLYVVFHVTLAGSGVTATNSHVIYRWSRTGGLVKIARGGDLIFFPDGSSRVLTFLETPIADDRGWVAYTSQLEDGNRAMVVWNAGTQLPIGVARVGTGVVLTCDSVSGAPCGPVAGTLSTMATFADRRGAVFRTLLEAGLSHRLVFRAAVNAPTFGVPDALWVWQFDDLGGVRPLLNLANSLQKADGAGATTYFDDFTDVALCRLGDVHGLVTVSRDAPNAIYRFDADDGDGHSLLVRGYAPDATPRRDLHCLDESLAYIGGYLFKPDPGDPEAKGVFFVDLDTGQQTQVWYSTVEVPPEPPAVWLGSPVGQAVVLDRNFGDLPATVFAAKLIGPIFAGREGIYVDYPIGLPFAIAHENDVPRDIDTIWSAAVNDQGDVAVHLRGFDMGQEVRVLDSRQRLLGRIQAGDPITIAPGDTRSITSFWLLGGTFGNDVVVTGPGTDGHASALTNDNELALLINYSAAPGGQPGVLVASVPLAPEGFADGFEDVTP